MVDTQDKDYLLQVKIKNAPMLRAMKRRGYETVNQMAEAIGMSASSIGHYSNLKMGAFTKNGDISKTVLRIAEHLNVMPSELFPAQHYVQPLEKNTAEMEVSLEDVEQIMVSDSNPMLLLENNDFKSSLENALGFLTPRQESIIRLRFYEDKTLAEVAEIFNVSAPRIRVIEESALRRLRRYSGLKREDMPGHKIDGGSEW